MKRLLLIALLVALAAVLAWLLVRCGPEKSPPPVAGGDCYERAEEKVATWKEEGRDAETIQKLFQAELARCSGIEGACAAFFGAGNADLAFLGRAVLTELLVSRRIPGAREGPHWKNARGAQDTRLV